MNLCIFTGRLTRDPENRSTTSGKSVTNFSIAINEGKDANGEDRVLYIDFEAWDYWSDWAMKYLTKGKPATVQSRMRNETWDDKTTGEKRSKNKFVVEKINFVPGNSPNNSESEQSVASETKTPKTRKPRTPVAAAVQAPESGFTSDEGDDEDIPF